MKWLYSALAFVFVTLFVSGITSHVFLSGVSSGFEDAKKEIILKSDIYANETVKQFYIKLEPTQAEQINQIKQLTTEQKQIVLKTQCLDIKLNTSPFCDSRFISGTSSFDGLLREAAKKQFIDSENQAVTQLNNILLGKEKHPVETTSILVRFLLFSSSIFMIIVSFILSMVFYFLANENMYGIQTFFGNVAWLSVLSAFSFKIMSKSFEKLFSIISGGKEELSISLTRDILLSWISGAIKSAVTASVILFVIGIIVWAGIKFYRNNEISIS